MPESAGGFSERVNAGARALAERRANDVEGALAMGTYQEDAEAVLRAAEPCPEDARPEEAWRLLDEFDRYASTPGPGEYHGSPFQAEVRAALAAFRRGEERDG